MAQASQCWGSAQQLPEVREELWLDEKSGRRGRGPEPSKLAFSLKKKWPRIEVGFKSSLVWVTDKRILFCIVLEPGKSKVKGPHPHFEMLRQTDHLRSGVQDQSGQHGETLSLLTVQKLSQVHGSCL
ncbi:hypothetical protein AAY473_002150 [Plecturocebus cupreus]